jgi:1-acyl-sn-glycerol-3-phosphate acyltransferase
MTFLYLQDVESPIIEFEADRNESITKDSILSSWKTEILWGWFSFLNFSLNFYKIKKKQLRTMVNFEEELKMLMPNLIRWSNFALLGKRIEVEGKENFVKNGPNLIVGNHIGSYKDIATLFKIAPRPIFFIANKMIFSKEEFNFLIRKHLKRHLKEFGFLADLAINPLKSRFVNFISTNIAKAGTIPVDIYKGRQVAREKFQEYLKKGRAIIALQGRGRVMKRDAHPYVSSFKRGYSIIAYNMYKSEEISVPVTPLAFFGTQVPFMIPAKIKVNVGSPMYIADYMTGGFEETIEKFRNALEAKVKSLFIELLKK